MSSLGSTLMWTFLQTTLLALLTLALGSRPWRIGGSSAPLFGLIGVASITFLAFLPIPWSWSFPSWNRPVATTSLSTTSSSEQNRESGEMMLQPAPLSEGIDWESTLVGGFFSGLQEVPEPSGLRWTENSLSSIVIGLFGVGILIGTLRLVFGLNEARRLLKACSPIHDDRVESLVAKLRMQLGLNRAVRMFQTDRLSTAATLGVWRPRILLPRHWQEWSEAELKAVLAHELAHIAHGDFAAVMISQLSVVVHFYHPLVHWLSGRLRLEQELAADSVAARFAGGEKTYVRLLAKLALEHQDRFVGWPARPFLPTRQTFLRRLEMLRDGKAQSPWNRKIGRWFAIFAIGLAAIVLVGLKPQANSVVAQEAGSKANTKGRGVYDLRYFSDEGGFILAARPAEMLGSKEMVGISDQIQNQPLVMRMIAPLGIEFKDIEQVIVSLDSLSTPPSSTYLRASKPIANLNSLPGGTATTLAGADVKVSPLGDSYIWKPDERSLVFGSKSNVERFIQGLQAEHKLTESELWKTLADRPLLVIGNGQVAKTGLGFLQLEKSPLSWVLPFLSPIVGEAEVFGAAISIDQDLSLTAIAKSNDAKGASVIKETSQAAIVLMKNGLRELRLPSEPPEMKNMLMELHSAGTRLVEGLKGKTEGTTVSMTTSVKVDEKLIASISSMLGATKRGAERLNSANNMKQLALGFHNFNSAFRQLPHTTLSPNTSHKHPVSWRVKILPFIDQVELYEEYRFDEPWDGPNNLKLLAKMPAVYRHPDAPSDSTMTNYVAISGAETIFVADKKARFEDILDGTSNTIMLVESKTTIPWTKPDDLVYASDKPLPSMGGFSEEGFHAAFADGSVRFISKSLDKAQLRALFTAKGGEVLQPATFPSLKK